MLSTLARIAACACMRHAGGKLYTSEPAQGVFAPELLEPIRELDGSLVPHGTTVTWAPHPQRVENNQVTVWHRLIHPPGDLKDGLPESPGCKHPEDMQFDVLLSNGVVRIESSVVLVAFVYSQALEKSSDLDVYPINTNPHGTPSWWFSTCDAEFLA